MVDDKLDDLISWLEDRGQEAKDEINDIAEDGARNTYAHGYEAGRLSAINDVMQELKINEIISGKGQT